MRKRSDTIWVFAKINLGNQLLPGSHFLNLFPHHAYFIKIHNVSKRNTFKSMNILNLTFTKTNWYQNMPIKIHFS